jgi:hypothetical protein
MRATSGLFVFVILVSSSFGSPVRAQRVLPWGTTSWADTQDGGIRGITVGPIESSQWPNRGYGSQASAALLDELVRMGTTWISITPFGRVWSLSSTDIQLDFEAPFASSKLGVSTMIRQAKERGLRVLLIPHLWVETGGWRGEMDPASEHGWLAYQQSYRDFIMTWARVAGETGADAFSIGVECKSWSGRFGSYWNSLITEVRAVFPGFLTYSANWDEAENVLFWDQLDLIGINAFYPLAQHHGASYEEYVAGAKRVRDDVHALATRLEMPVLFVEVGYTTRQDAAVEPWLWPDDMTNVVYDEPEQARALSAIFEAFLPERWFTGFFVWRYYADLDDISQEDEWGFSPHGKLAEPLLRDVFSVRWGADRKGEPWTFENASKF